MNRPHLSQRQAGVLELITQGLTYEEIGHRLGIGVGTVRSHVRTLHKKYGVRNRSALTAKILSGNKRALVDVLDFIEEFTGAEESRHPMFSEGYDLALSHVKELVEARLNHGEECRECNKYRKFYEMNQGPDLEEKK